MDRIKQSVLVLMLGLSLTNMLSGQSPFARGRGGYPEGIRLEVGMRRQEVVRLLGSPSFVRDRHDGEEYVYCPVEDYANPIIRMQFRHNRLIGLQYYYPNSEAYDTGLGRDVFGGYGHKMPEADFSEFFERYQSKPFRSDKEELLRALTSSGTQISVEQCIRLLQTETFDSDKLQLLKTLSRSLRLSARLERWRLYKIVDCFGMNVREARQLLDVLSDE